MKRNSVKIIVLGTILSFALLIIVSAQINNAAKMVSETEISETSNSAGTEKYFLTSEPVFGMVSTTKVWDQTSGYGYVEINYINNSSVPATLFVTLPNMPRGTCYFEEAVPAGSDKSFCFTDVAGGNCSVEIKSANGGIHLSGVISGKESNTAIN